MMRPAAVLVGILWGTTTFAADWQVTFLWDWAVRTANPQSIETLFLRGITTLSTIEGCLLPNNGHFAMVLWHSLTRW